MSFMYCAMYFAVGKLGAFHLIWAVPMSYIMGRIINIMMKKMVKEPLGAAIKNVNLLSEGNLNISIDLSRAQNDDDMGVLIRSIDALSHKLNKVVGEMNKNATTLYT